MLFCSLFECDKRPSVMVSPGLTWRKPTTRNIITRLKIMQTIEFLQAQKVNRPLRRLLNSFEQASKMLILAAKLSSHTLHTTYHLLIMLTNWGYKVTAYSWVCNRYHRGRQAPYNENQQTFFPAKLPADSNDTSFDPGCDTCDLYFKHITYGVDFWKAGAWAAF